MQMSSGSGSCPIMLQQLFKHKTVINLKQTYFFFKFLSEVLYRLFRNCEDLLIIDLFWENCKSTPPVRQVLIGESDHDLKMIPDYGPRSCQKFHFLLIYVATLTTTSVFVVKRDSLTT